jgi:predicted flap endonuclease-1-like 5' DNA nuclease
MNTVVFFLAGITIGLVTDKLYHSYLHNQDNNGGSNNEGDSNPSETAAPKAATKPRGDVTVAVAQSESTMDDPDQDETVPGAPETGRDDLTQLKGVGVKLASALDQIGITSFEQLAGVSADSLWEQLKATGGRFSKPTISSIVEQAKLTAKN